MIEVAHKPNGTVRLTPHGDLSGAVAASLMRVVAALSQGGPQLEINLANVPLVDAMGLSSLVTSVRRVEASGGDVSLNNIRPSLRWRLECCGLVARPLHEARRLRLVGDSADGPDAA